MSSHHNESQSQSPYDGSDSKSNGFQSGNGNLSRERSTPPTTPPPDTIQFNGVPSPQVPQPVWDRERRELRFGKVLVKRFKWPAENQERVLNAFQDNGWPAHIEDPLEQHPSICPKRRLHDTLKCLNRKQINAVIKFRGDGTGLGVKLEINPENAIRPGLSGLSGIT